MVGSRLRHYTVDAVFPPFTGAGFYPVDNPIVAAQDQLGAFIESYQRKALPRVIAEAAGREGR